ncbi:glycosyltransferase family protein [Helicobacter vulpis]|uniref:hypothetical protein n=1 Tax=Helicobacter vulpis TaxID=2316076 RepID=UPI000EAFD2FE|nr:hypothetical protein [Helicobacter vulpis]
MTILLSTEQYYPLQTGLASADYGLTHALAKAGHVVYVISADIYRTQRLHREGKLHMTLSADMRRQAIEIAPNLFVLEFHIYYEKGWQGEIKAYQDFVRHFECDLLITSAILTWTSDYILDVLPQCVAKKKVLRLHGEYDLMCAGPRGIKQALKDRIKKVLYSPERYKSSAYIPWLRAKLKTSLKHYDRVFFLHARSHGYHYLKPYCTSVGILPNGVFAKDILPPKSLPGACLTQHPTPNTQPKAA